MAKPNNSLSSIISLTRSQYGQRAANIGDDDLDRFVVEELLRDAQTREAKGYRTGSATESKKRTPNLRFLSSVINNVASHNSNLLKIESSASRKREEEELLAQEIAAADWRKERGKLRGWDDDIVPRNDEKGDDRNKRSRRDGESDHSRSRSRREQESSGAHRHGSSSKSNSSRISKRDEDYRSDSESKHRRRDSKRVVGGDEDEEREERRSSSSRYREKDSENREEERSSKHRKRERRYRSDEEDDDKERSKKGKGKEGNNDRESTRDKGSSRHNDRSAKEVKKSDKPSLPPRKSIPTPPAPPLPSSLPPPPPSMPPPPLPPTISKMDKYFESNYDPLLDIAHTEVPSTGLLTSESSFESWSNMLEILKIRKEEKKLKEIGDKSARKVAREAVREERRLRKEGKVVDVYDGVVEKVQVEGLLEISGYAKKGGVREWDRGKN